MSYIEPREYMPDPILMCACREHFYNDCEIYNKSDRTDKEWDLCDECGSGKLDAECHFKRS